MKQSLSIEDFYFFKILQMLPNNSLNIRLCRNLSERMQNYYEFVRFAHCLKFSQEEIKQILNQCNNFFPHCFRLLVEQFLNKKGNTLFHLYLALRQINCPNFKKTMSKIIEESINKILTMKQK